MQMSASAHSQSGKVLIIVLIIVVLAVAAVGGMLYLGQWALDQFAEGVRTQLASNPVVLEHIGEIEEWSLDMTTSGKTGSNETFVFEFKGSKDAQATSGTVTATIESGGEGTEGIKILSGSIKMADGSTHDLFP